MYIKQILFLIRRFAGVCVGFVKIVGMIPLRDEESESSSIIGNKTKNAALVLFPAFFFAEIWVIVVVGGRGKWGVVRTGCWRSEDCCWLNSTVD